MGDRNNPIKFGPEWLRNLARERSAATSGSNSQNVGSGSSGGTSPGVPGPSGGSTASTSSSNNSNNTHNLPKVQLAKLRQNNALTVRHRQEAQRHLSTRQTRQGLGHHGRYGREEMLALYDRNTEAPPELKSIDVLYQPRGKPPSALANTFEEDTRDNARSAPPIGGLLPGDRFGLGRGMGRGLGTTEGRGRARGSYLRQLSLGRGTNWNAGAPRMPVYSGSVEDDSANNLRSWNNNTNMNNANNRNTSEQAEWQSNKMFRNKRPGANTNWRQSTRDEGDEWRSDTARSRHQDKWERDWGDRPAHEKPSWNSNRRTWVGGETQNNEENLPEWAVDNAEACGGTFDSSGAFHGYSNDDSNLPKAQDSAYALTRSHTHGSVVRQKTAEEGSEEWWASEKAKKLSPKRFDAGDIKFKKTRATSPSESGSSSSNNKEAATKEDAQEFPEKYEATNEQPESYSAAEVDKYVKSSQNTKYPEGKTFDALMRSDINMEESSDERGNFQSVMIAPNNSLRQKHQNMVPPIIEPLHKSNRRLGMLRATRPSGVQIADVVPDKSHNTQEDKLVEEMFDMALEEKEILPKVPTPTSIPMMNQSSSSSSVMSTAIASNVYSRAPIPNQMPMGITKPVHPGHGMPMNQNNKQNMPAPGIQSPGMQPVGITNSALNASLGLPLGGPNLGMPLQGVPPPVLPNVGMPNPGLRTSPMQGNMSSAMQAAASAFQSNPGMVALSAANVGNNSLFMRQNSNNATQMQSNEMQMTNHSGQTNMFPMHGLQHSGSQAGFGNSIYSNLMQQSAAQPPSNAHNLADQWYYEDPKKIIQGPFLSKEMYNWYRAGFFSPSLMVRRACDTMMRPLGSYGPMIPFAQMDMMPFPMPNNSHENMLNSPQSLALDMMNMPNLNMSEGASVDGLQFGSVGIMRTPSYGQTQMVDSLWSQPSSSADLMWMQHTMNSRNENRVNNLSMFFWDQQPSAIAPNSLLPDGLPKEMKTEEQILAQLRATQNIGSPTPQTLPFLPDPPAIPVVTTQPDEGSTVNVNATPNLEELHKLIQKDTLVASPPVSESSESSDQVLKQEKPTKVEVISEPVTVKQQPVVTKTVEPKPVKQIKIETDKTTKNKDNAKNKSKKLKEDKKDDAVELKVKEKEEEVKIEKRSAESSPSKTKKEEKVNKKELEKEKKEWIKEGFTVVKGSEKNVKESKKKVEETKATEEADRKKKEEEKLAADEEKKKKQSDAVKKQQEQMQQQQQRQSAELVIKKAPWSASNQSMQATNKDGLTLAEIQRLEREKKLEQIKEQQHMMAIIAQQQAVALAREQEMQAGLGWAKKKGANLNSPGQSLTEIQAEARKQSVAAAAAAAAAAQALEEVPAVLPPITNHVPWGNSHNGGGFWDTQQAQAPKPEKPQEAPKNPELNKIKKKVTVQIPVKKETSPSADFENWCTVVLSSWSSKIDVPTFVGFLKDIESPYEVKDYVKCYLGETKESGDFARQFLERRSKLLRVGMVTPSDDLCSPAMAVNPRAAPSCEYQEVKGKGKKTKKNKMLKVDARILGFSVTAAEDRINVGDIDSV